MATTKLSQIKDILAKLGYTNVDTWTAILRILRAAEQDWESRGGAHMETVHRLLDMVEDCVDESSDGQALWAQLRSALGPGHQAILDLERLKRFQAFKVRAIKRMEEEDNADAELRARLVAYARADITAARAEIARLERRIARLEQASGGLHE